MKYWCFYFKNNGSPFLYAITNNKKMKDSFQEERNMKLFQIVEHNDPEDYYTRFISEHHSYNLGRRGYETSSSNSLYNTELLFITSTEYEELKTLIKSDFIITEIAKYTDLYSEGFNKELLISLYDILYFEILKFKKSDKYYNNTNDLYSDFYEKSEFLETNGFFDFVPPFNIENSVEDYKVEDYKINLFAVFMLLFGYTMKP